MKFNYFKPKTADFQARSLAVLLPRGRAWNSQTGTNLYKLVYVLSKGLGELRNLIFELINEFRIETSKAFLILWEQSLGIVSKSGDSDELRRGKIKAQVKKVVVVSKAEWEQNLREATGNNAIEVFPVKDFIVDSELLLPNPVPTPLYLPFPDLPQNRFILIADNIEGNEEEQIVRNVAKKYIPSNNFLVIIDRNMYF